MKRSRHCHERRTSHKDIGQKRVFFHCIYHDQCTRECKFGNQFSEISFLENKSCWSLSMSRDKQTLLQVAHQVSCSLPSSSVDVHSNQVTTVQNVTAPENERVKPTPEPAVVSVSTIHCAILTEFTCLSHTVLGLAKNCTPQTYRTSKLSFARPFART